MQGRPVPPRKPWIVAALAGLVALAALTGGAIFGYVTLTELQAQRAARAAAEIRAAEEELARIDAVNLAAQEKVARLEAVNAAGREKQARIAAQNEALLQTQARQRADEMSAAESAKRVQAELAQTSAETAQAAAEQESQQQTQARIAAETRAAEADSARRLAERMAAQERSANFALQQEMSAEQAQGEKARVLEMAKTHPMIQAVVSGDLKFYIEPLPRYAAGGVSEAVDDIAASLVSWHPFGTSFRRVYQAGHADLTVGWIKDYGSHTIGESIHRSHVKVGLGTNNCLGDWMAFDAATVKTILWHELGHSMGYEHSQDPGNVMYATLPTRFAVDHQIEKVIAGGWLYTTPLCSAGTFSYSFETTEEGMRFDIAVLPSGTDIKAFSGGRGRTYAGCGRERVASHTDSCTAAAGAVVYIANSSFDEVIRINGTIVHQNQPFRTTMAWDPAAFTYNRKDLKAHQELFAN